MTPRFKRPQGQRRYKRLFVVVAEGTVTEQEYFDLFQNEQIADGRLVRVKCLRNSKNLTPRELLKNVKKYVETSELRKGDEAWAVVDRDSWPSQHFAELHAWSQTREHYGFALSNPKFEYWLLLHFEDGRSVGNGSECDRRLAKYLAKYDKHLPPQNFDRSAIESAVRRAKDHDSPPCEDWPHSIGTTVYRLVERILQQTSN